MAGVNEDEPENFCFNRSVGCIACALVLCGFKVYVTVQTPTAL